MAVSAVVTAIAVVVVPFAEPAGADSVSSAQAQAAQLSSEIQAQATRLAVLSEEYDQGQIRLERLDAQVATTRAAVARMHRRVDLARARLRRQAIEDYITSGSGDESMALFASSGVEGSVVQEYQAVAGGNVSDDVDGLRGAEDALDTQEHALTATRDQARAAVVALDEARNGAENELAAQQATLAQVKGRVAQLLAQQEAAEQAAQAAAFRAEQVASARAAASSPGTSADGSPSASTSGAPVVPAQAASSVAATGGAGSAGAPAPGPSPAPLPVPVPTPAPPPAGGAGAIAVAAAESQLGVPYVWGGATPGVGFDCSGLTMWAWAQAGVSLPHSAALQYADITHIPLSDLEPGDLLFYDEGGVIGHVTMYIGDGEVIQAPETGETVSIAGLWSSGLVGAGRP